MTEINSEETPGKNKEFTLSLREYANYKVRLLVLELDRDLRDESFDTNLLKRKDPYKFYNERLEFLQSVTQRYTAEHASIFRFLEYNDSDQNIWDSLSEVKAFKEKVRLYQQLLEANAVSAMTNYFQSRCREIKVYR